MTLNLPSGMLADSVAIGDVTGDGRADVIVGTTGVLVFPQTASGLLGAPITYKVPPTETALIVDVGDVNGDGLLDVVYTRKSGVGILLGNSSGGLDPAILLDGTQGGGAGEQVVAVADLNGDGRADVVAAGWATAGVDVWFQDQAGALSPTTTFACPHGGSETMAVGDVDGDGLSDILISGLAQTDVCVLLQAPGGFAPGISIPAGVRFIAGLAVGRFGAPACGPDIAFTVSLNSPMSKLGLLGPPASPGAPAFLDSYDIPTSSVVADVDGDGRDDIVLVHDGWNAVGVYRGLRSGGVAAEERYPFSSMGSGGEAIAVGDINGDGRPDVVGVVVEDVVIAYHR
jgi:hypothetical protein